MAKFERQEKPRSCSTENYLRFDATKARINKHSSRVGVRWQSSPREKTKHFGLGPAYVCAGPWMPVYARQAARSHSGRVFGARELSRTTADEEQDQGDCQHCRTPGEVAVASAYADGVGPGHRSGFSEGVPSHRREDRRYQQCPEASFDHGQLHGLVLGKLSP